MRLWVAKRLSISPTPDHLIPADSAPPGQVRILVFGAVLLPRLHSPSNPAPNQENICQRRRPSRIPLQGLPPRRFPLSTEPRLRSPPERLNRVNYARYLRRHWAARF